MRYGPTHHKRAFGHSPSPHTKQKITTNIEYDTNFLYKIQHQYTLLPRNTLILIVKTVVVVSVQGDPKQTSPHPQGKRLNSRLKHRLIKTKIKEIKEIIATFNGIEGVLGLFWRYFENFTLFGVRNQ